MGFAHKPKTAVLPMCSKRSMSAGQTSLMRCTSTAKAAGQHSSYPTTRTTPSAKPKEQVTGAA